MRPQTLDEVDGQDHLIRAGTPLGRLAESSEPPTRRVASPTVTAFGRTIASWWR